MQSDSEDSQYDTPPGDEGIPEPTLSTTGPVTKSQAKAHQLAMTIRVHGLKLSNTSNISKITTFNCGWQIADCPCHNSEYWLNISNFNHRAQCKCLHKVHFN